MACIAMAQHGQAVVITPVHADGRRWRRYRWLARRSPSRMPKPCSASCWPRRCAPARRFMYGAFTSNVRLCVSGAPAFGTPENAKANIASGQLVAPLPSAIPYVECQLLQRCADAQGAYETEMSLWARYSATANLIYHAAGWQEGGLTASFEKLVLDVEMLAD